MTRPISTYWLYFSFAYVGMLILFAIISMFISSAGSSGSVIAPFIAAMIIGQFFVKKENRAPSDAERNSLTTVSFLIFLAINAALLGLVFLSGGLGELSGSGGFVIILGVMLALISVLVFFMIRWAYGGLTRKYATKLLGDQNSTFD